MVDAAVAARADAALDTAAGKRRVSASTMSRTLRRYSSIASVSSGGVEGRIAACIAASSTSVEACTRVRAAIVAGSSHDGGAAKNGRRSRAIASAAPTATLHARRRKSATCPAGSFVGVASAVDGAGSGVGEEGDRTRATALRTAATTPKSSATHETHLHDVRAAGVVPTLIGPPYLRRPTSAHYQSHIRAGNILHVIGFEQTK